jgi:hypothetical protein
MTSYAALAPRHGAKSRTRLSRPLAVAPVHRAADARQRRNLLPDNPGSIPTEVARSLPLQRQLEFGSARSPLEAEADSMATRIAAHGPESNSWIGARSTASASPELSSVEAPPIVHETLRSTGQPLDPTTRAYMEPRLGADLGGVRIHADNGAAAAARAVHANAYTVGSDIFFAPGRYRPHTGEGRWLLAHELSHTVQQAGGGAGNGLPKAAVEVQRDPAPPGASSQATQGTTADTETKKPKTEEVTVPVPPALLSHLQLTPPSLLAPPQHPPFFSPGAYTLGGSGAGLSASASGQTPTPSLGPPGTSLLPPPSQYAPAPSTPATTPSPYLAPVPQSGSGSPAAAPSAPERLSLHDFGRLSIGVRIGFPDLSKDTKPGDPPSALQESLKKGEILNFILTGQPPSEYSIDPGKLVGAVWGIFSTRIDPGLARKIAASVASKPTGGGPTYQLDATILLDLGGPKPGGGGGATLTVSF